MGKTLSLTSNLLIMRKKITTFIRYFVDFLQYGQIRLVFASFIYILTKKSIIETRIFRGKLGFFLHRKGSLDFQFGNYAYEWSVKQVMLNNFSKYDVFFDIGANIGTYTILMASKGLKTFSFEPVYSNFKALNINILLNNLENNAVTFNYGLSYKAADASFVFDPLNTGASHISTMPAETIEAERRSIPTTIKLQQLDDVYQTLGLEKESKIFMKIDVEGMESQVILGAKEFLKSFPNIMIVMESVHSGEEKLKNILSQIADFEFFTIDSLNMGAIKKNEKSL